MDRQFRENENQNMTDLASKSSKDNIIQQA